MRQVQAEQMKGKERKRERERERERKESERNPRRTKRTDKIKAS